MTGTTPETDARSCGNELVTDDRGHSSYLALFVYGGILLALVIIVSLVIA